MREIPGRGVSIVDHGLRLNVCDGVAMVYYDAAQGDYFEVLKTGTVYDGTASVQLSKEQLSWLRHRMPWVDIRLADQQ